MYLIYAIFPCYSQNEFRLEGLILFWWNILSTYKWLWQCVALGRYCCKCFSSTGLKKHPPFPLCEVWSHRTKPKKHPCEGAFLLRMHKCSSAGTGLSVIMSLALPTNSQLLNTCSLFRIVWLHSLSFSRRTKTPNHSHVGWCKAQDAAMVPMQK